MCAEGKTIAGLAKPQFSRGPREIWLGYAFKIMQIKPILDVIDEELV